MRLRARPADEEASKTKRRGRQARYGSIETSGTARVKNREVRRLYRLDKKNEDKLLGLSSYFGASDGT